MFYENFSLGYQKTQNFTRNSLSFLPNNFFPELLLSPFSEFWNQNKILRILYLIIILMKIFFQVILALFANFKCICSKKNIFRHFSKTENLLFCRQLCIILRFLIEFPKNIKLKPPSVQHLTLQLVKLRSSSQEWIEYCSICPFNLSTKHGKNKTLLLQ